jgi:16S rRNA G966 N2-methylase RsmD
LPAEPFAALDPCAGDGVAFTALLENTPALRYGIELDSYRAEQARKLGIDIVQGNALETQCRVDSLSLVYLNPPYDFEVGKTDNQRMEIVFLRHTGRWVMPGGVLIFILPQRQLAGCARTLAEHFENIRLYRLTEPESVKYNQVAVLAVRRKRQNRLRDEALESHSRQLEQLSQTELAPLPDRADILYPIPPSAPATLVYHGLPLDEIEDRLIESSAYRQVKRILLRERASVRGRPLTPLHGGHVGLLCTAGMLNGVFGEGELRHLANWQSRKYTRTWHEEDDGKNVHHTREYFAHECTLLWADGTTQVLTHEAPEQDARNDPPQPESASTESPSASSTPRSSKVIVMPASQQRRGDDW